jgi:hypothetical protein
MTIGMRCRGGGGNRTRVTFSPPPACGAAKGGSSPGGPIRSQCPCENGLKQWVSCAIKAVREHSVLGRCWVGISPGENARGRPTEASRSPTVAELLGQDLILQVLLLEEDLTVLGHGPCVAAHVLGVQRTVRSAP